MPQSRLKEMKEDAKERMWAPSIFAVQQWAAMILIDDINSMKGHKEPFLTGSWPEDRLPQALSNSNIIPGVESHAENKCEGLDWREKKPNLRMEGSHL